MGAVNERLRPPGLRTLPPDLKEAAGVCASLTTRGLAPWPRQGPDAVGGTVATRAQSTTAAQSGDGRLATSLGRRPVDTRDGTLGAPGGRLPPTGRAWRAARLRRHYAAIPISSGGGGAARVTPGPLRKGNPRPRPGAKPPRRGPRRR